MHCRQFLAAAVAAPFAGSLTPLLSRARAAERTPTGWRQFRDHHARHIARHALGPAQLWLPAGANCRLDTRKRARSPPGMAPDKWSACTIARYGAPDAAGQLGRNNDRCSTSTCRGHPNYFATARAHCEHRCLPLTETERRFWTAADGQRSPVDGIVRETAVTHHRREGYPARPVARALRLGGGPAPTGTRTHSRLRTGQHHVSMLRSRSDSAANASTSTACSSALARAAGFPARDVYGIRVAESRLYPCARPQWRHFRGPALPCGSFSSMTKGGCRSIAADVRKVALEQKARAR